MNIEVPDRHADAADAFGDGFAAGASSERARIAAIMDSDAGKERPAMARKLAMTTDMTAEAAAAFMADLPVEKPLSRIPSLAERHAAAGGGAGAEAPSSLDCGSRSLMPYLPCEVATGNCLMTERQTREYC